MKKCAVEALKGKNLDKIARTYEEKEKRAKKIVLDWLKDKKKVEKGKEEKIPSNNKKKYIDVVKCAVKGMDYQFSFGKLTPLIPPLLVGAGGIVGQLIAGQSWQAVLGNVAVSGLTGAVNQIATDFNPLVLFG